MSINELTTKIRELREMQALIEEARTEADALRDAIKAHMGSQEELRVALVDDVLLRDSVDGVPKQATPTRKLSFQSIFFQPFQHFTG